jgi:hypothetical protein
MRRLADHPLLIPCLLAAIAYAPALNNGFIADDYVILQRIDLMRVQPLYLFHVPPENFRFMSYIVFAFLKSIAGYDARVFYAFNIALHIANIALLRHLLILVAKDSFVADTASILFAVFQAPQEAVMWLAAMNETTLAFFTLIALTMWWQKRYAIATAGYAVALFSKESGIIILFLIGLLELKQRQWKSYRAYGLLLIPTAIFAAVFLWTMRANFMIANRFYAVGPHAILVLLLSLHRLVWPWLYIVLFLACIARKNATRTVIFERLPAYLALVMTPMLPYIFIAYQNAILSRQLYMASAVLMTVFALLLKPIQGTTALRMFIVVFVGFNIGYLWLRKDAQFEDRAAPTTQLIAALRLNMPQPVLILNFAYPYPAVAQAAALAVPGWRPELIQVDESPEKCAGCLKLRWNTEGQRYEQ